MNWIKFSETQLNSILEFISRNLRFDNISDTILREKILDDPDFDPDLILGLWEKDHLVGFLSAVIRNIDTRSYGFIKFILVEAEQKRCGLGEKLYNKAESILKEKGVSCIRIGEAPVNYFQPGIDSRDEESMEFLKAMGFQRFGQSAIMQCDLISLDVSTESEENRLAQESIEITRAGYEDMQDVFEFVDSHFPRWRTEVTLTYNSLPVSLHLARMHGAIMGFAAHNTNNFGNGWFGPVAVLAEFQKKGIGSVLLKRCLQDMKDWGLEQALIPWAEPQAFFEHSVQARVARKFIRFEKKLG